MIDPQFKYCPLCATPLLEKYVFAAVRPTCPQCGFVCFLDPKVVAIVAVCHEDKVLLGKRNMNPGKGEWSFLGGYVERGEKIEDAAVREVKEESGLDVHLERLIGLYSETGDPNVLAVFQGCLSDANMSSLFAQADEITELAFFPWHALPALAFAVDYQIIQDLKLP